MRTTDCLPRPARPLLLLAMLLLLWAPLAVAQTSMTLQPGDTVSVTVTGFPELSQRMMIQPGGWVTSLLLGRIDATGADIETLQARMRERLASRPYERMTADGRLQVTRLGPETLLLDIDTYRPVYVTGDVARPGEQNFRPGLTVRQAIALAGGVDAIRGRISDAERLLRATEARAEITTLGANLSQQRADITRLRLLLDRQAPASEADRSPARTGGADERLALVQAAVARDRAYVANLAAQAEGQLQILRQRLERETEGADADFADYERVRALHRAGTVPIARVSDARRAWQFASTQSLQTLSRIGDVEREHARALRDLGESETRRRVELEQQLARALVDRTEAEARLVAAQDRLLLLGGLRTEVAGRVQLRVHRRNRADGASLLADQADELWPGDVLEVTIERPDASAALR